MRFFKRLAGKCASFESAGRALAWSLFNFPRLDQERTVLAGFRYVFMGKSHLDFAMHRGQPLRRRPLFPLPLGNAVRVKEVAKSASFEEFCQPHFAGLTADDVWLALAVLGLNGVAGHGRVDLLRNPTQLQKGALDSLKKTTSRVLPLDVQLQRSVDGAEKELSSRYLSYTGEEIPKMQVLRIAAAKGALPPIEHGGSIDTRSLLSDGSRWFLEHPEESLLADPPLDIKLQAKVHIHSGEALEFCRLLVERNVCRWVADEDVLRIRGVQVLNGMFAVGKGTFLDNNLELQRTIMNLIPTNAVFKQSKGGTDDLPSITQYLSLVVQNDESLRFFQSDMTAAFYLFKLPVAWSRMMCFNIRFTAEEVGLAGSGYFRPGCSVIPMGWSSAVSIMQELASKLTTIARLPSSHQVRRQVPLPPWLTDVLEKSVATDRPWFHIYLDNFCCMQKCRAGAESTAGQSLHQLLEDAWSRTGVLSSAKKRVSDAPSVQELGAYFEGEAGTVGPSGERLLKLMQTTLVCLGSPVLKRKWIQVVAGRWVHCMSFRRPSMVCLDSTWTFVSGKQYSTMLEAKVRSELLGCCCLGLLIHSNLRAGISETTTASDASMSGGAVGKSVELTLSGSQLAAADRKGGAEGKVLPIMVLSLFNGIGCAFRSYDLCGVTPQVAIAYEVDKSANRVTARRWPNVLICGDVRSIDVETIRNWRYEYPSLQEIHIWGGFPCVGLSAVRFGRLNLDDPQSSLFWELVRVIKLVRQVFGFNFKVLYAAENVASMDASAEGEITQALGVKPLRLDPSGCVPIHRPRLCWTNSSLTPMDCVTLEEKARWIEVDITCPAPDVSQWLEEGAVWPGHEAGEVFPTCMKAIRRTSPPLSPAGLNRVDNDTRLRWIADEFRFPPYQYADRFLIWVQNKWRLLNANERELLHGLGWQHTSVCWNANEIKRDPQGFEDKRKSLIGDSFSCFSFAYVAAMMCSKWISIPSFQLLADRMGMAPGFVSPLETPIPLQQSLAYGNTTEGMPVSALHSVLLRRVNHTGSDVRVSTGALVNPRAFPRQSAAAAWWKWDKVFAYKWCRQDHINSLELRAILHAIEWRVSHLKETELRIFHLTDSYVAMSVIAKGRSSSKMLRPLLARLAVLLMAFDLYLVVCHVESTDNPTDHASRA